LRENYWRALKEVRHYEDQAKKKNPNGTSQDDGNQVKGSFHSDLTHKLNRLLKDINFLNGSSTFVKLYFN